MFTDIGVANVQIEDDAELSSYQSSELGLEDERVAYAKWGGGLAEILVVTLFFLILTEHGFELELTKRSTNFFGGGGCVLYKLSASDCSINLVSQGLAAIHLSNQLHPPLTLFISGFLTEENEEVVCELVLEVGLHCC